MEFYIPYTFTGENRNSPREMFVEISVEDEFEQFTEENYGEHPPRDEDACVDLARKLDERFEYFVENGLVTSAFDRRAKLEDVSLESKEEICRVIDDIEFVY